MKPTHKRVMKTQPVDFERRMTVKEIQHWNRLTKTIAEAEIKIHGFYACTVDGKKTIIVAE